MFRPPRPTEPIQAHRLSATRLYGILLLFLILAGYAIWNSERFQNLIRGISKSRLSAALGAPVSFETVDLRFFPPSVRLAHVRIGNDPDLHLPLDRPLLEAEEVTIGGGASLVGRELRLGRIRAVRPKIRLVQSMDGRFNIPPGLSAPSRGGLKVHIASALVQEGVLEFEGRKAGIDGRFDDFAAELTAISRDRYEARVLAGRATLKMAGAEPLVAGVSARFSIDSQRGLSVEDLRATGSFGQIQASGEIENLDRPNLALGASGDLVVEEVERIFRAPLGFRGAAHVDARIEIPPVGGFRVTGRVKIPLVRRDQFSFEEVAATVVARPEALVAQIEQAGYAGGRATGVFRIGNLTGKPQPMTLEIDGQGISLERFFGDLGLAGTGLSGSVALDVGLRWGQEGLERANGGGSIQIQAGSPSSLVRGRFGIPTGGGGLLAIVNGRIGFEEMAFRFPQSTLELAGGLKIGQWQPDFDLALKSRDFSEVDHLFQNFVAATGGVPEPLGLGGSGQVDGHVAGTWSDPDAAVQLVAEQARSANVAFGSVRGTVEMREGAFFFRPLRVYDGDASLSLEGMARYRILPGRARFDLSVAAHSYPISRLLKYLDFHFPIEGKLTGAFPVSGTPEQTTGGGSIELADATVWGQEIPLVRGAVRFTPGRFALEDVSAEIGGGMVRGSGSISVGQKTFEARAAGDAIPLGSIQAARSVAPDIAGKLSFQLSGSGSLERPDLKLSASLSRASFFGHPVPEGLQPHAEATMTRGVLDASVEVPQRWALRARGDLFGAPARIHVALDASDLAALLVLTPFDLPAGQSGSLGVEGDLTLPSRPGEFTSGTLAVTRARLDLPDRPGVLATSGVVHLSLADGKLTVSEFSAVGEGTSLKVSGRVGVGGKTSDLMVAVNGSVDASALTLLLPDLALQGRLTVDARAVGTFERPSLEGSVRIENGRYRLSGQLLEDVEASVTFRQTRGDLEARAKFGGGDLFVGGGFSFDGMSVRDFRLSVQGRQVRLPTVQDFRLIADADLVATGGPSGNSIRGEVVLLRGTYSRDFDITLSDLIARSRPSGAAIVEPWKLRTALDVRIVSSASLEVRNNVARLTGTVDLIARGTLAEPALLGQIVLDEGGRVTFRNVRYDIESGTITFANARGFAPILDVHARAEVKGYDLVVGLVGTWPRIQTSFSSDPPLPDETILALLLTGTAPSASTRTGSDMTASIVSAGAGIAAGTVTGGITRGTQRILGLERFEIDPVFTGGQLTDVRSTIGKQITPDILFTYSQSFETTKQPIYDFEWRISDTVILRGQRDENGIYLVDIRRRQRF